MKKEDSKELILDDSKAIPPLPLIKTDEDKEEKISVEEALKQIEEMEKNKK